MRNILLAILVSSSALVTGCTDDLAMDQRDLEVQPLDATDDAQPEAAAVAETGGDFCAELPSEGPCSLACDPDALIDQYVPHGQCVMYRCELTSGAVFRTGGCNP